MNSKRLIVHFKTQGVRYRSNESLLKKWNFSFHTRDSLSTWIDMVSLSLEGHCMVRVEWIPIKEMNFFSHTTYRLLINIVSCIAQVEWSQPKNENFFLKDSCVLLKLLEPGRSVYNTQPWPRPICDISFPQAKYIQISS